MGRRFICKIGELDYEREDIIVGACKIPPYRNADEGFPTLPIGVSYAFVVMDDITNFRRHPQMNTQPCLARFRTKTDNSRRAYGRYLIAETLERNKIRNGKIIPAIEEFNDMGAYRFVVSPEGYNYDCYRHYETWLSQGVPIIERNPLIEKKYEGLPILWTTDYSEITKDYLGGKWDEFKDKT